MIVDEKCVVSCDELHDQDSCAEPYCTWLYSSPVGDNGLCVNKSSTLYSCTDIKRITQCASGGDLNLLSNMCYIESGLCISACTMFDDETQCINKPDLCYWLKGSEFGFQSSCREKV